MFLSTDTTLSFLTMMEVYATRWTIEVFFKEMKQHLRLGRCPSRDFDAQIAHVTICCNLYPFLAYFRRIPAYQSLGVLFEGMVDEWVEKNLAQRLWALFEELLQVVMTSIAEFLPQLLPLPIGPFIPVRRAVPKAGTVGVARRRQQDGEAEERMGTDPLSAS